MKMEKCNGGVKIACQCDDKMTATMPEVLHHDRRRGAVRCCMMMNGMMVVAAEHDNRHVPVRDDR